MTTKQHDGILFFLFAVSVAALVYGQDFFMNRMLERKAESRALRTESMTLETETKEQVLRRLPCYIGQKRVLKAKLFEHIVGGLTDARLRDCRLRIQQESVDRR